MPADAWPGTSSSGSDTLLGAKVLLQQKEHEVQQLRQSALEELEQQVGLTWCLTLC
jgi:hypothetical protein